MASPSSSSSSSSVSRGCWSVILRTSKHIVGRFCATCDYLVRGVLIVSIVCLGFTVDVISKTWNRILQCLLSPSYFCCCSFGQQQSRGAASATASAVVSQEQQRQHLQGVAAAANNTNTSVRLLPGAGNNNDIDGAHGGEEEDAAITTTNTTTIRPEIHQSFSYQEEFKVSITSPNAISIELLDGGICLDTGGNSNSNNIGDDDTDNDDDIREYNNNANAPLTRIQRAIQTAVKRQRSSSSSSSEDDDDDNGVVSASSSTTIEKLDLFASHFRANLTAPMMASILQVLPPLKHLQLGGLCLPVQELCQTLMHPSLKDLSHLALYDLVFLRQEGLPATTPTLPDDGATTVTPRTPLALEELVAVFIRLDDQDVTLDPLLNFLTSAPLLRQLELVMDHSHAYFHGYPRPEVPQQQQQQQQQQQPMAPPTITTAGTPMKILFSAETFSKLLRATSDHLQLLFLEYVPLRTEHFQAMAKYGKSITQLRLRDDPDIGGSGGSVRRRMMVQQQQQDDDDEGQEENEEAKRLQSLASLLRDHPSLHTVTLDGLWTNTKTKKKRLTTSWQNRTQQEDDVVRLGSDEEEIFRVVPQSNISSLRLRSLPMRIHELDTLLGNNKTLQSLSLHNIAFTATATAKTSSDDDVLIDDDNKTLLDEETVFAALVKILKNDNCTLRRLAWKEAEFRRTEVFPRHRKPKSYRCFQQRQEQQSAQHQLHWYLTLNQRGIRYLTADIDCSRNEFLDLLIEQQQQQQRSPHHMHSHSSSDQQPGHLEHAATGKAPPCKDSYDANGYELDCLFHMILNNPSICR